MYNGQNGVSDVIYTLKHTDHKRVCGPNFK